MLWSTVFINFSPTITMESFTLNHSILIISLHLLIFSLSIFNLRVPAAATSLGCALVNCGEGTCKDSNSSVLGFECECNPGWKKIQIDCALVWCGKGTCVANETGYTCQCSQGAANLFGNPAWACLDTCSFGADCEGLGLGLPTPNPPPPPVKSGSTTETGPAPASNCARNLRALTMMLFATVILAWF
ncbi:hypothetical protein Pint_29936 [Pistacia integerrima]|uniref:Uncharacterized protein n=1 Tax=Pistacia integerrima TaxID=434235 RepID=A0ACC0X130_9ROSI|nr:hypothetical protein Pint_29936 [Pistacia integerrima]